MQDKSGDRDIVIRRLAEDLIGPHADEEELSARPSDVYLTGILWPRCTAMSGEDDERLGTADVGSGEENDGENDAVKTKSTQKPSVAGISFSASSAGTPHVRVICSFATYQRVTHENTGDTWVRKSHRVEVPHLSLSPGSTPDIPLAELDENLPKVFLKGRCIHAEGAVLSTLSLVNLVDAEQDRNAVEAALLFQTAIRIEPCDDSTRLVPKPRRAAKSVYREQERDGLTDQISDEESGELLYRNVWEFAVGHICSAEWDVSDQAVGAQPTARWVGTTWLPSVIVEGVDPNGHPFFSELGGPRQSFDPLSTEALANADTTTLYKGLQVFCEAYCRWIQVQRARLVDTEDVSCELKYVAEAHLDRCEEALERMRRSVDELAANPRLRRAFQLANFAMHLQHSWDSSKSHLGTLRWRPFQLGFLLLSAPSSVDRGHPHREVMDLLWFSTGGGKTEAYLALIACIAVYRRLSGDPHDHSGVCALMRYTLRLLTTQQFVRSSAMIVALEAIRSGQVDAPEGLPLHGEEPFSIGLWVGGGATPNRREDAYASSEGLSEVASPEQLTHCPACSKKLKWSIESATSSIVPECTNSRCTIYGTLPVFTVDDDVYDNRPTLLIGTVDKFAQIVREPRTNSLFGVSDGSPPDLIIQDELHLISGPLGTIAGVYEAAFDLMFSARGYRTKIIGSTATIRRASEQVLALFDREVFQFPPPAIDHDDSGFAVRDRRPEAIGRRYFGVTTVGRSAKFTLQAAAGSLLQTAFGAFSDDARRDAYWTLTGYFNSLRELGGALVLMQDDVTASIASYAKGREEEKRSLSDVEELTSRRTQEEIRDMLSKLDSEVGSPGVVDAVLATNMVSVGMDISRLGLMLVNGQPKTIAEYIQSTSRVGRGEVGGLVLSVLNNAKARDRSHFETFCSWHRTLYRDVEATSVTPFASRARDKALHAALVAAVRHLVSGMLDSPRMDDGAEDEARAIIARIVDRAKRIDPEETSVQRELERRVDSWKARAPEVYWSDFKGDESLLQNAERAAARRVASRDTGAAWPTLNSMRTVEAGTPFRMASFLNAEKKIRIGNDLQDLRRSAVVSTFGPGSVVDFRVGGGAVSGIAAGLEEWDHSFPLTGGLSHPQVIREARLQKKLGIKGFRTPPVIADWSRNGSQDKRRLVVVRFPKWLQCPSCNTLKPEKQWMWDPGKAYRYCSKCTEETRGGNKVFVIPVRFVMACKNGHVDEFPWDRWVRHKQDCPAVSSENRRHHPGLILQSERPGLAGLILSCPKCGARRSMDGVFSKKSWEKGQECRGKRPWLADADEKCSETPRAVQRGASNLYFAVTESALSIPPWSDRLQEALGGHWSSFANLDDLSDLEKYIKFAMEGNLEGILEELGMSLEELAEEIRTRIALDGQLQTDDLRPAEYRQFVARPSSSRTPDTDFEIRCETVAEKIVRWGVSRVVRAVRLREVRAIRGFTRINPPGDLNSPEVARLSRETLPWLPAIEVRGEGIFLALDEKRLSEWERQSAVEECVLECEKKHQEDWGMRYGDDTNPPQPITPRYMLCHTLAHALMRQLTIECGYSSASLQERIYAGTGDEPMAGLLIYTATTDSDGTLGGLERQGKTGRFEGILQRAIEAIEWCSSDPLCSTNMMGAINNYSHSVCHACCLVPETSCESFNSFLARALLIDSEFGFFSDMLRRT